MNTGKTNFLPTVFITVGLVLGLLALPAGAASLLIDDFSTAQGPLTVSPQGPQGHGSTVSGSGVLGGQRDMLLQTSAGPSPFTSSATVAGGVMDYSNSTAFTSTLSFQWDGPDNNPVGLDPTGLGGVDLTSGGNNAFEIGFIFDDLPATLEMNIYTSSTLVSSFTFPTTGMIFTSLSLYIPFSLFSGDADFANVGAIELIISSPTNGADISFDFIQTAIAPVPVPGAIWLLGSALLGFVTIGRRQS